LTIYVRCGQGVAASIPLTDAIESLLDEEQVLAYRNEGSRFDCGDKLGYRTQLFCGASVQSGSALR
jgi:UTP-glucose-1-phosphate uridylyltransferase